MQNHDQHLHSKSQWSTLAATSALTALFWWQPAPVRTVLGWSGNLGPAMKHFEMRDDGMAFHYAPSPDYKMRLTVKPGPSFHTKPPPQVAIWLENQGGYQIKTLLAPEDAAETLHWAFKHAGWQKTKREAGEPGGIDAVSSPHPQRLSILTTAPCSRSKEATDMRNGIRDGNRRRSPCTHVACFGHSSSIARDSVLHAIIVFRTIRTRHETAPSNPPARYPRCDASRRQAQCRHHPSR